ncbi:LysR substrate-binding domain-containing protein [Pigmentiphaga soli]|uniref:LysR substrate-binding domain-containing protein n=1 Tax=Pigmentiphaga soli TaxID=1007095 RepID=A0ABP8HQ59_9BURK
MLFEDLNAFIAVAKLRSFSAAAVRLRVAQSSLSKRVQRLEHHFGVPLLNRHGRGVSLTEAGTTLLARAQRLADDMADVERDVRGIAAQPTGTVRIALPPATSPLLAPLIFEQCRIEFPLIRPQLRESTSEAIHAWLSAGEVDIALMYNPEYGADFEIEPMISEPLFLIAPAFERESGRPASYPVSYPLSALATLPLILPRWPHSIRVLVERLCAGNGIHPNIAFESDSIRSTKSIVERGFGCTLFSRAWLAQDIEAGRLRAVPFSSPLVSWKLCIAHARREDVSLALMSVKRVIERKVRELFQAGTWPDARLISPAPDA